MLKINVISGVDIRDSSTTKLDFFCSIKCFDVELFKTKICSDTSDPIWNETFEKSINDFRGKEKEFNRSVYFEKLVVEVYSQKDRNSTELVGEIRIPLLNIGFPLWYNITKSNASQHFDGRILIGLSTADGVDEEFTTTGYLNFNQLHPDHFFIEYSPLFLTFNWSPLSLIGMCSLPGPSQNEVVHDRYENVERRFEASRNIFGDIFVTICKGTLYITDVRIIFIANSVQTKPISNLQTPLQQVQYNNVMNNSMLSIDIACDQSQCYNENDLLILRRLSQQIPLSCVQDCKYSPVDLNSTSLSLTCKDSLVFDFLVKRVNNSTSYNSAAVKAMKLTPIYRGGLLTENILPSVWCSRVCDDIKWKLREDKTWLFWAKHLRATVEGAVLKDSASGNTWLRKALKPLAVETDYHRMHVEEVGWQMSDLNARFELCTTYPQTIVVPACLNDDDIQRASQERSRERFPGLVWLHPYSHVPLCRSSQPLAGLNKTPENDKRLLLSIKNTCPTMLPLRIADCRPRLNAQANAIQGKGYENTTFYGGPSVCSLAFLDIHNIHIMRESIQKLREDCTFNPSSNAHDSSLFNDNPNSGNGVLKWLTHVSGILVGSISTAESILVGHPVLVHCSDGWDRTAQVTAIAQILLDPYYRTIDGFMMLLEKEWISYGHQFGFRIGKSSSHESSPVFLQYLDCVWQILQQFPTEFEFSENFLEIIGLCSFSGYFLSFRANCTRERSLAAREALQYCHGFTLEDLPYSSVHCYIQILLHTRMEDVLINPYYCPPPPSQRLLKYIRPRASPSDLSLWRNGLIPSSRSSSFGSGSLTTLTTSECASLSSGTFTRLSTYWNSHLNDLSPSTQSRIYALQASNQTPLLAVTTPFQLRRSGCRQITEVTDNLEEKIFHKYNILVTEKSKEESACTAIQLWYRSFGLVEKLLTLDNSTAIPLSVKAKEYARVLILSVLKSKYLLKKSLKLINVNQVSLILDDIVEEVLQLCFRSDLLLSQRRSLQLARSNELNWDVQSLTSESDSADSKRSSLKVGKEELSSPVPPKAGTDKTPKLSFASRMLKKINR